MRKLLLLIIIPVMLSGCWTNERGEKIGTLVKISKQGTFIGTWEAELIRGGMSNGSGSFGRPFDFTIEDPVLIEKAQEALKNQKEIRIKYHRELLTLWRCESDNYFLDDLEIVN